MAGSKFKFTIIWGTLALLLLSTSSFAANGIPQLDPIGTKQIFVGETLAFYLTAKHPEDGKVYFSGSGLPVNALLNSKTGLFSWTPEINQIGNYNFTFIAYDHSVPSRQTKEIVPVKVAYKLVRREKAWGFGLKETETVVETSSVSDLYPKIAKIQIDGQELDPASKVIYTSKDPKIQIEATSPYNIDRNKIFVVLDGKKVEFSPFSKVQTFGENKNVLSLTFEVPLEDLSPGKHTLVFNLGNELGNSAQGFEVSAGASQLLDRPLAYPSPYRPSTGASLTLQYTLSQSTDIEIFIVSSAGEVVKKLTFFQGTEGAKAGLNKPTWNGMTDRGAIISNGIYLVTIINKEDRSIIGKIKLAIY